MEALTIERPAQRRPGRSESPVKNKVRKLVTLPEELWAEIDRYRHDRWIRTDSEILRTCIELGFEELKRRDAGAPAAKPARPKGGRRGKP